MEAKGPVWYLSGQPSDLCILPRSLSRVSFTARQEVKVENASDDVILQRSSGVRRLVIAELDVHPGRAQKQHGVSSAGAVLEVHRMRAVQVRALRDAVRVPCPHRARRVGRVEPERFRVLTKTVDVRRWWERRLYAEVLGLEDERVGRSREKHFARAHARNVERERRCGIRERNLCRLRVHVRVGGRPR